MGSETVWSPDGRILCPGCLKWFYELQTPHGCRWTNEKQLKFAKANVAYLENRLQEVRAEVERLEAVLK